MSISPESGAPASNQFGTFTVRFPSEAQRKFVARLAVRKGSTDPRVAQVAAGTLNLKATSRLIDELLELPDAAAATTRTVRKPASSKQVALIAKLATERVWVDAGTEVRTGNNEAVDTIDLVLLGEPVESFAASRAIDHLFACGKVARREEEVELESGMYRTDGVIFKVYRAVHGSGRMCAKELVVDGPGKAHFEYRGLATRFTRAADRMTLEEAMEFGAIYGVCCQCGATLTAEESIEAGIGPVCAGRI